MVVGAAAVVVGASVIASAVVVACVVVAFVVVAFVVVALVEVRLRIRRMNKHGLASAMGAAIALASAAGLAKIWMVQ